MKKLVNTGTIPINTDYLDLDIYIVVSSKKRISCVFEALNSPLPPPPHTHTHTLPGGSQFLSIWLKSVKEIFHYLIWPSAIQVFVNTIQKCDIKKSDLDTCNSKSRARFFDFQEELKAKRLGGAGRLLQMKERFVNRKILIETYNTTGHQTIKLHYFPFIGMCSICLL